MVMEFLPSVIVKLEDNCDENRVKGWKEEDVDARGAGVDSMV